MQSKPKGRIEVRKALVKSAAMLFANRGIAAVSIRDIAKEAKVNHGLVHRHFGSKNQLIKETVQILAREITTNLGNMKKEGLLNDLLSRGFIATRKHTFYWKILAHLMLIEDGEELLQEDFPFVNQLLSKLKEKNTKMSPEAIFLDFIKHM